MSTFVTSSGRDTQEKSYHARSAFHMMLKPRGAICNLDCAYCYYLSNGGCPKDRILRTPDGEPGLNYLCAGYKAFFTHIDRPMRLMAAELKAGRPPANIMLMLAHEDAERQRRFKQAGRNDPCPCGSGRTFKKCHGASPEVLNR